MSPDDRHAPTEKLLRVLIAATALFVVLLFIIAALRRWRYPYELEELEGYSFLTALRAFHGQPLYTKPSLDFVMYMYPPLYFYAAAALGKLMGMSISALRLTSILSTFGCFGMIFALVWTEAKRWLPAIAAVGLYAGCYTLCQQWFDLGRLDSFFVFLILISLFATRRAHPVLAALCWTLTFLTKQSILPAAFLILLAADWTGIKRSASGLITLAATALTSVLWLNHVTHGWYSFYVFAVPGANSDISPRTLVVFWPEQLLRPLLLTLIVIVAAAVLTRPSLRSPATRLYLAATCSLIPLYWIVYAHGGSTANAMMPVYALLAVLFGIAIARLLAWLPTLDPQLARSATLLLLLAVFAQEVAGIYNPGDYRPNAETRHSLDTVVATIKTYPGDVLVTQHPYYAWLAGKPTFADLASIHDALRPSNPAVRADLSAQISAALTQHRFNAILLDQPDAWKRLDTDAGDATWQTFYNTESRLPNTETSTRPDWLLEPCILSIPCKLGSLHIP